MRELKSFLISTLALASVDYRSRGRLYVVVDASQEGARVVLEQEGADGKRHPYQFKSTVQSKAEASQHLTKLECRAILQALKKFRLQLYSRQFTIKIDT